MWSLSPFDESGHGVTLTVRDMPTDDQWRKLTRRVQVWCRDNKASAIWVVEWQRRGVPHMHLAIKGAQSIGEKLVKYWLRQSADLRSLDVGQHVTQLYDRDGFIHYLVKHATKGYGCSFQKDKGLPTGWRQTGRMWGVVGNWSFDEVEERQISDEDADLLRLTVAKALELDEPPDYWRRTMIWYADLDIDLDAIESKERPEFSTDVAK